jgi:hypothetical protein
MTEFWESSFDHKFYDEESLKFHREFRQRVKRRKENKKAHDDRKLL